MPAAAKAKTSRKASEIEPKAAAKSGSKKQKVVEEVEEDDEDDEDDEEDKDDASDDDEDDDEEEEEEAAKADEPEEEEAEEEAEGAFKDESLECKDCGNEFVFSAGEQEFYQQKVCQSCILQSVESYLILYCYIMLHPELILIMNKITIFFTGIR